MKSAKSVVSVVTEKLLESTAQYHWKFPSKSFSITADRTDYTDCAAIFTFDYIHLFQTASITYGLFFFTSLHFILLYFHLLTHLQ